MELSAKSIAELLEGEIIGDPAVKVNNISKIEEGKPGTLSFLANPQYEKFIYSTRASIVLVNHDFKPETKVEATMIKVRNAYEAFARVLEFYNNSKPRRTGIDPLAFVDKTATIGKNVFIAPFACVDAYAVIGDDVSLFPHVYIGENASVGNGSVLNSGVKVYNDCKIGAQCTIHSCAIIGGDGFGFAIQDDNNRKKVPQIGNVIIEDHVEIGSNTTIDRATIGSTILRKGVKLDNLIQIAHNVEIGENTVVASQTGISGSTKVGANCMIGGQVGIIGHIKIADEVKIAAQSGIGKTITEKGAIVQGSPAFEIKDYQKSYVLYRSLPNLKNTINKLERELAELKATIEKK
ncbi:MAG: UDP-3-O-(3-hydroxymyristoyl)glucosamine N-acyltransferase [Bacteroidetes bacterium GWF2_38_335]|nr:MAG: UDP-3-O-(3-hydroxymyristoyl)glucosamine N-acyltransferase [Bacteroidetes bacterium GWF2_38_335]OFY81636.1 MAG: UDP-3-O-(3-hydroxymyristoyl)glucosamine N-acyltransferase [Bacteroidetes bacterium RIFOXYA12_FULL_38_20]HBS88990.1 UDP-3-O-(3-hydroxymyristoyl)glucosamine N-acyltransferase [Bacteroidales bacterium]